MDTIVAKFGGSSLADADQLRKMKNIIGADASRKYVVPSAPGKRFADDTKVTDMLYDLHEATIRLENTTPLLNDLYNRYAQICSELNLDTDLEGEFQKIIQQMRLYEEPDYAASRGEYLNGLIIADYLGYDFIDAADVICFDANGKYDHKKTMQVLPGALKLHERAVIPGFYGRMPNGRIKTFSRGGSDITGSIVACAANAKIYENWTDVSGFMIADPRIVENPKKIDIITYRELRELAYMGATVLHEDCIFPVLDAAIPINIKNTNEPRNTGTLIVPELNPSTMKPNNITGIAGRKNFTVITIEKDGMNAQVGYVLKVMACLQKFGLSFEHIPSSIDSVSIVIDDAKLKGCLNELIAEIHLECKPDSIEVESNMALIATVGHGMNRRIGIAAKLFSALASKRINIRMIDQGSSEINIIVGVANDDFEKAINAIYNALV